MELTLQVNDDVARKIRGLCVLTGKTASQITEDIGDIIDAMVTQEIIESVGGPAKSEESKTLCGGSALSGLGASLHVRDQEGNIPTSTVGPYTYQEDEIDEEEGNAEIFYKEQESQNSQKRKPQQMTQLSILDLEELNSSYDETEEVETAVEELTDIDTDDEEELDETLPATFFAGEEENEVAIKNRLGADTSYEDELMADIQAMAEDDNYETNEDGLVAEDPALAAASPKKGATISTLSSGPPNDASDESIDALPVDYGIDKVAGNDSGAKDFFSRAFFGEEGDKTQRNGIKRKVVRRHL